MGKPVGDLVLQLAHEGGNGGEVWNAVPGQDHEGDVLLASLGDIAAADHAAGVGVQDDLEHHARRIRRGAAFMVLKPIVQNPQIEFVIDQVRQGVFKGAGEQLNRQINGQKLHAGVDGFVAGHRAFLSTKSRWTDIAGCK